MEITLNELKEMLYQGSRIKPLPFEIGKSYLIRTVTYHAVGRVSSVCGDFLVLSDASWVADSGRFAAALKSGDLNEVEPFASDCILNTSSIIDATEWSHKLPKETKE